MDKNQLHPVTCLIVDFNDGTPPEAHGDATTCASKFPSVENFVGGPLTNPYNVTHVYLQENIYNVSVIVVDFLISLRTLLPVVVAWLPCNPPVVWLPDNATLQQATTVWRSRAFRVDSEAIIVCNGSVASRKSWSMMKVEGEEGIPVSDVILEGVLASWNFSQLSVPPLFLEYGTYCITYRLQLLASKIFPLFRTASTYFKITKSPLQAVIIEGGMSKLSRGYGKPLLLDPVAYSMDPDWPGVKMVKYD
ncbi:polycystic kidney disease protein 1-like 1 [Penaeus monodon]|uniref:polycystic kidney disease protein 1-like 1 n=1 Tax=Penaeus monodon TaxID=6687 RepID=UPI0018A74A40|nr:polycystic kidney disease protein 1-like 1 [Penaeus monodon]